jgi:hypothetical protein
MAKKRRLRKTGEWEKLFGKQNAQPAPEPVVVVKQPITVEPVIETKPVAKKKTTKKKTTAKKKVEVTESIAAPAVQEEVTNGLVEIEESKPKRRSWLKKVTTNED